MNVWDIVIIVVLSVAVLLILIGTVIGRKKGKRSCGCDLGGSCKNCSGCMKTCDRRQDPGNNSDSL